MSAFDRTVEVPPAVRSVSARGVLETERGHKPVYGTALSRELRSGTATLRTIVNMHRFFTLREGELRRAHTQHWTPDGNALLRSVLLLGGEAGRKWAAQQFAEAVERGEVDPDPVLELMALEPEEIYDAFQAGAWRYVYSMDARKAARFVEHYTRNTQRLLDLDRAFGESAIAVGKALYRRFHAPDPFEQAAKLAQDKRYAVAVAEDLEVLGDNRAHAQLQEAFKRGVLQTLPIVTAQKALWPAFIAYFVLAVEAPHLLKEINKSSMRPPTPQHNPKPFTAYNDVNNTYIAFFHSDGARYPKGADKEPDLDAVGDLDGRIFNLLHRAWKGQVIRRPLVYRTLLDAWTEYIKPYKLGRNLYRLILTAWRAKQYQKIADNIPPEADVYGPFQQFVAEQGAPPKPEKQPPPPVDKEQADQAVQKYLGKTAKPVGTFTTPLAHTIAKQSGKQVKPGDTLSYSSEQHGQQNWTVLGAYQNDSGAAALLVKSQQSGEVLTIDAGDVGAMVHKNIQHVSADSDVESPTTASPASIEAEMLDSLREFLREEYGHDNEPLLETLAANKTLTYKVLLTKYLNHPDKPEFGFGTILLDAKEQVFEWVGAFNPKYAFSYDDEDGVGHTLSDPILVLMDTDGDFLTVEDGEARQLVKTGKLKPLLDEYEDTPPDPEDLPWPLKHGGHDYTAQVVADLQDIHGETPDEPDEPPIDIFWETIPIQETAFYKAALNKGYDVSPGSAWTDLSEGSYPQYTLVSAVHELGDNIRYVVFASPGQQAQLYKDESARDAVLEGDLVPQANQGQPAAPKKKAPNYLPGSVVYGDWEADWGKHDGPWLVAAYDYEDSMYTLQPMTTQLLDKGGMQEVPIDDAGYPQGIAPDLADSLSSPVPLATLATLVKASPPWKADLPAGWPVGFGQTVKWHSSEITPIGTNSAAQDEQVLHLELVKTLAGYYLTQHLLYKADAADFVKNAPPADKKARKTFDVPGLGILQETPEAAGYPNVKIPKAGPLAQRLWVPYEPFLKQLGFPPIGQVVQYGQETATRLGYWLTLPDSKEIRAGNLPLALEIEERIGTGDYHHSGGSAVVWWNKGAKKYDDPELQSLMPPAKNVTMNIGPSIPITPPDVDEVPVPGVTDAQWTKYWIELARESGLPFTSVSMHGLAGMAKAQLAESHAGLPDNAYWYVDKNRRDNNQYLLRDSGKTKLYYMATLTLEPNMDGPDAKYNSAENVVRTHVFIRQSVGEPVRLFSYNAAWPELNSDSWNAPPPDDPALLDYKQVPPGLQWIVQAFLYGDYKVPKMVDVKELAKAMNVPYADKLRAHHLTAGGFPSMFLPGKAHVGAAWFTAFKGITELDATYKHLSKKTDPEAPALPKHTMFDPFDDESVALTAIASTLEFTDTGDKISGGSNPNHVLTDKSGRKWFFKVPKDGESVRVAAEVAASLISREVHRTAVPVGALTFGGKHGTIQPLVPDVESPPTDPDELPPTEKATLLRQHAVDMFLGDHDGHSGNWLRADGRLVPIDRGQSFKFLLKGIPESLDPTFHPDGNVGVGYAKTLLVEWAKGNADIPATAFAAMKKAILTVEGITDDALDGLLKPVLDAYGADAALRKKATSAIRKRKKNYLKDWTAVLLKLRKDFDWPSAQGVPTTGPFVSDPDEMGITEVEEAIIADAVKVPVLGKSLSVDRQYIEQQQVMVRPVQLTTKKSGDVPGTLIYFRLTPAAQQAVDRLMLLAGVSSLADNIDTTGRLGLDKSHSMYEKLLTGVKTIHYHLYVQGDTEFNKTSLSEALGLEPLLKSLKDAASKAPSAKNAVTGDKNEHVIQMTGVYAAYIRYIKSAVDKPVPEKGTKPPKMIEPYVPPEEAEHETPTKKKDKAAGLKVDYIGNAIQVPSGSLGDAAARPSIGALLDSLPNMGGSKQFRIRDEATDATLYVVPPKETKGGTVVAGYAGVAWGMIPHDVGPAAVAHLLRMFESATEVPMKPAAKEDRRYLYWFMQGVVLQQGGAFKGATSGKAAVDPGLLDVESLYAAGETAKAIEAAKKYVAGKLGTTPDALEKLPTFDPEPHYARGVGFGRFKRIDVDVDRLKKALGPGVYPCHRLMAYSHSTLEGFQHLEKSRALVANNLRPLIGVKFGSGGSSPGGDLSAGGSGVLFGAFRRRGSGGNSTLYFDHSLLLRTDVYVIGSGIHYGDAFGRPESNWTFRPEDWKDGATGGGQIGPSTSYQLNIRHDVDLSEYLIACFCSPGTAKQLIKWCYEVGWTKFAGGRKPEDVFFEK